VEAMGRRRVVAMVEASWRPVAFRGVCGIVLPEISSENTKERTLPEIISGARYYRHDGDSFLESAFGYGDPYSYDTRILRLL